MRPHQKPDYGLRHIPREQRGQITNGLRRLRRQLNHLLSKPGKATLLAATWNIREFGAGKNGGRLHDALCFMAEIIRHFDVVAVQEINRKMDEFNALHKMLGPEWGKRCSEPTYGHRGNRERLGFLYHKEAVGDVEIVGNLVLPPLENNKAGKGSKYTPVLQPARAPYYCVFTRDGRAVVMYTVHILYGESKRDDPDRLSEIKAIANLLADKAEAGKDMVVLGDFNIFHRKDQSMTELMNAGFVVPSVIWDTYTNQARDKQYDQIAILDGDARKLNHGVGGVLDYYESVFRKHDPYAREKRNGTAYTTWRSYQMSDHLVLWLELKV